MFSRAVAVLVYDKKLKQGNKRVSPENQKMKIVGFFKNCTLQSSEELSIGIYVRNSWLSHDFNYRQKEISDTPNPKPDISRLAIKNLDLSCCRLGVLLNSASFECCAHDSRMDSSHSTLSLGYHPSASNFPALSRHRPYANFKSPCLHQTLSTMSPVFKDKYSSP